MLTAARDRVALYRLNIGGTGAVWNGLILVALVSLAATNPVPAARIALGATIAVALGLGYAIVPLARWRITLAARAMSLARWSGIGILAVNFIQPGTLPAGFTLLAIGLLLWSMAGYFWIITEPGVLTQRGQETLLRRMDREEPV